MQVAYISVVKSAYISGIVMMQRVCEIIAIDAPVDVSPPYAAGNTTVLRPSGVPNANSVSTSVFLSAPNSHKTAINSVG